AAGRAAESGAEPMLDALIGDPTQPAMARASALLLLPRLAGRASLLAWRAALGDPDPLVRLGAVRALPATASNAMQNDEAPQRAAFSAAMAELIASETLSADRPEAHLNLGLLYERRQLADQADAEYQTALRLDPKFVPAMVNLADLDRLRGMDSQGADLLRKAIALEPENAAAHHALGLLLVRQHFYADAVT